MIFIKILMNAMQVKNAKYLLYLFDDMIAYIRSSKRTNPEVIECFIRDK